VPTAAEYRDAAQRYRAFGRNLTHEAAAIARWVPDFVGPGAVRTAIDESVDATRRHLAAAGDEMQQLALICESRADVCAQHARAIRWFHQLAAVDQALYGFPLRPATWVDP
jgi:hypothetical protein